MPPWLRAALTALAATCSQRTPPVHAPEPRPPPARVPEVAALRERPYRDLEDILRADPQLAAALDEAPRRRIQILVAVPTRDEHGKETLRRLSFRVDAEFFYPASSIKLCTAVAALEKLQEARHDSGDASLTLATPLRVIEGHGARPRVVETSLGDELERALVVSDNEAHSLLFELVGREEIAERMARLGHGSARVVDSMRLWGERPLSAFAWLRGDGQPIFIAQRIGYAPPANAVEGLLVGTSHVDGAGRPVDGPMDFGERNRVSLRDLQDLLVSVIRPDLRDGPLPKIGEQDRAELVTMLGTLPSEMRRLRYPRSMDDQHKPLVKAVIAAVPEHRTQVFGKNGRAYGFSVENAYVTDTVTGRSFFLAATLYANDSDRVNDDNYDYAAIADPFVSRLGQLLARVLLTPPMPLDM